MICFSTSWRLMPCVIPRGRKNECAFAGWRAAGRLIACRGEPAARTARALAPSPPSMRKASIVYVGMFLVLIVGMWVVLGTGAHLRAPAAPTGPSTFPAPAKAITYGGALLTLFMQIGLIVALSRGVGWLVSRLHQSQAMG